jgi:hypothetical protein
MDWLVVWWYGMVWYGVGWYLASTEHRRRRPRMMTFIFWGENVGFGLVWFVVVKVLKLL